MNSTIQGGETSPLSAALGSQAGVQGTNIAGAGLSNLLPEIGPDLGHWIKHHLLPH